jgi:hypothetical protein
MNEVGFIDKESILYTYPKTNIKYNNNYTEFKEMDSVGNDIPGAAFNNATLEQCKSVCNANDTCGGFVTTLDGSICYPKTTEMYPLTATKINSNTNMYVRQQQMITPPIGASNEIMNIDSVQYQNYIKGSTIPDSVGLLNATSQQKEELVKLQKDLSELSSKMVSLTQEFKTNNNLVTTQSTENVNGIKSYLKQIENTMYNITNFNKNTNMDNIVNQSDMYSLQKNYSYILWTILALGIIITTISITKKYNT